MLIFIFYLLLAAGCSKDNTEKLLSEGATKMASENGSRIAWDFRTLRKVSLSDDHNYNGYARLIQRKDGNLLCVYESDGNVITVRSNDLGNSWTEPIVVATKEEGINMAVPDILELQDHSILVCYNPRPFITSESRKFGIRTKKSYDGGFTWKDERQLYEAGHEFENGCWEPSAIQLPDGEIQLFFANEGLYPHSSEQNISSLRSKDNGLSWTEHAEIVSFRPGSRDGMPSPLLLQNKKEIVLAIEDNGFQNFKPYIIRSSIDHNWAEVAGENSSRRSYALKEKLADHIYAGAPYLRQLKNGETVLSYQGTEGRENKMEFADMKVVIGDENALNFSRKTVPFLIPGNKSALWSSIAILEDQSIVALTSTSAYSQTGKTEVWMIKGQVVELLQAHKQTIHVDGATNEDIWHGLFPVFIGHTSETQTSSQLSYDDEYLYVISSISDKKVEYDLPDIEDNDGLSIYLDVNNFSYDKPDQGIFKIFLSAGNKLKIKEGAQGKYQIIEAGQLLHASIPNEQGYVQELGIPWQLIGGKPEMGKRIGFNISLTESSGKNTPDYIENISSNDEMKPYTWMSLYLL